MPLYPGRVSQYATATIDGKRVKIPLFHKSQRFDIPTSYFVQASQGGEINDVVHAKLVSSSGETLLTTNCTDRLGNYYHVCGPGDLGNMYADWNSNYKGLWFFQVSTPQTRYDPELNERCFVSATASVTSVLRPVGPLDRQEGRGYYLRRGFDISIKVQNAVVTSKADAKVWDAYPYVHVGMDTGLSPGAYTQSECKGDWSGYLANKIAGTLAAWASSGLNRLYSLFEDGSHDSETYQFQSSMAYAVASFDEVLPLRQQFLFGEDLTVGERIPSLALGNGLAYRLYWRNWLVQHAYVDALQSAPRLNDNSVSNVIELVGFIKALVVDHRIEIPKSLQSAWLEYRYVYKTTRLDVEDAIRFVKRNMDLGGLNRHLVSRGTSEYPVKDSLGNEVLVRCRCQLELAPATLGWVDRIWRALYTYGLQPNFYVVWDMIPYSFIVDWFIPIGDSLSVLDTETNMLRGQYNINNVCFSLSYVRELGDYNAKFYTRWASEPLSSINEFYWFDKPPTSERVRWFRVFDSISLLTG